MNPALIVVSLAEQPAYYALYALYVDYLRNNPHHRAREYFARLQDLVKYIQPLVGRDILYMKSWSLRLFTERAALERFSPEQAATAWWLVRQAVDAIGAPRVRPARHAPGADAAGAQPAGAHAKEAQTAEAPQAKSAPRRRAPAPPFPRSPVDYRMAV